MDRLRQSGPFLRRKLDFLPDGGILGQLPARSLAMEYIPTNIFGINWTNRFLLSVMEEDEPYVIAIPLNEPLKNLRYI